MRNRRPKPLVIFISAVMVFSFIFINPIPILASPGLTVDSFEDTFSLTRTGPGTISATSDDASILGGERDVVITVSSGTGYLIVDTNTSKPGQYSHGQGPGIKGRSEITYDGNDNDPNTLNPTGLGGIDITDGGVDTALVIIVTSDDYPAFLQVTLFTDATSCSRGIVALPGGITSSDSPKAFLFPYSSFTDAYGIEGCTSPVTLSNIGAIKILIDGTANESTDITIDLIASAAVDFGDLPTVYGPTNFTTNYANSGPGHVITSLYLGSNIDSESGIGAASPMGSSRIDDMTGSTPDDEDGISPAGTPWTEGVDGGALNVTVTGGDGCLAGWIDWEADGVVYSSFAETDQILLNEEVTAGTQVVSFDIPSGALAAGWPASYYARFRLFPRDQDNTCTTTKSHKNQDYGGEVEDYYFVFGPTAVTVNSLTARPTGTEYLPLGIAACMSLLGLFVFLRRRTV